MQTIAAGALGRARWAIALVFFLNGAVVGVWAPHIPLVKERLAIGPGLLGLALLGAAAGALVAMPLAGMLMGRFGSAAVTRVSTFAFCAALPLPVLAPDVALLIAALVFFGMSGGAMDVAMNAHAIAVETRLPRPAMSSFHGMYSLGGLIGAGVGGVLLARMPPDWQAAGFALLFGLAAAAVLPGLLPGSADIGARGSGFALPRGPTLVIGVLMFLAYMGEGAILDWGALYLSASLGASATQAAAGFAVFSGAMAAGRFAGDRLRGRSGAVPLVRASALLASLGLGLGVLSGIPLVAILGFGCAGLGLSNIVPVLFGAAARVSGQAAGTGIAAVATMGYAGLLAGPPLLGFVAEATSLAATLGAVAAMCLLIALAAANAGSADRRAGAGTEADPAAGGDGIRTGASRPARPASRG